MNAIQIEVDDEMREALANDKKAQALGISEFLGTTIKSFLEWRAEREIDKQYARIYGNPSAREALEREVKEWIDEQAWID